MPYLCATQKIRAMFRKNILLGLFGIAYIGVLSAQTPITKGMIIKQSVTIQSGVYRLSSDSLQAPVIIIEGNGITVDFNGATLWGSTDRGTPDTYYGLGILIKKGSNVTIKNLKARGFQVALLAENVENLQILDSDFSYNYRQRLYSMRDREDFSDWLSYHQNDKDEWLRYGAGLYLKNCNKATVKGIRVSGGQNGLMLSGCNDGLFYNNTIQFNSGIGIGLYRSNRNRVMHNLLDWNVRGYSHGFYSRGQDSAGILLYEQSSNNTIAYNSATHCGDGLFLWAGQSTMDTGEGGCNNNLIFGNDFSYAPTNGIEVTFSSNRIVNNRITDCTYGIWGGYSYNTVIADNNISNNRYGIAIEHGQDNSIDQNAFYKNDIAIKLWQRDEQPKDWGYAQKRDVESKNYRIQRNAFSRDSVLFHIANTFNVEIVNENLFADFKKFFVAEAPNEALLIKGNNLLRPGELGDAPDTMRTMNAYYDRAPRQGFAATRRDSTSASFALATLPDGIKAVAGYEAGKQNIIMTEWGPYNFSYPLLWLDQVEGDVYTFRVLGPAGASWRVRSRRGINTLSTESGTIPAVITVHTDPTESILMLQLEYRGRAFVNEMGDSVQAGISVPFRYYEYRRPIEWQVRWYAYDGTTDPLKNYDAFQDLQKGTPLHQTQTTKLAYAWWGKPAETVPADQFATFAEATIDVAPGQYRIRLSSDDGIKLFLDGQLLLNRWNVHEPTTDEVVVELNGKHRLQIEHFDQAGLSVLDFRMEAVR